MKLAIMNDMHLPAVRRAVQYEYFDMAVNDIKNSKPDLLVVNGDITATGEANAMEYYIKSVEGIKCLTVLGNSDVRTGVSDFAKHILSRNGCFVENTGISRKIFCINTPCACIENEDRENIDLLNNGDILIMHYSIAALNEESRSYITNILANKELTLIHAHAHNFQDYTLGKSRVICLRALDPDKSIGAPPCITYFDITDGKISLQERKFALSTKQMEGFRDLLGISCFDIVDTVDYAIANNVKNLEIRQYSPDDGKFKLTVEKIKEWRKNGGQTLSIHMPNIRYDGGIVDKDWDYAWELAQAAEVNSMTIHPPRVSVRMMKENDVFTPYYCRFIESAPKDVKIGFENLHMSTGAMADETRQFGCVPEELCELIDKVNAHFGYERAGALLDVGHARNNAPFNNKYTLGMWYALIGNRTVAYHIHQVKRGDGKLKNHCELDEWFGPMISYSSFFRAWSKGQINHRPMFMEMRELSQAICSFEAFRQLSEF